MFTQAIKGQFKSCKMYPNSGKSGAREKFIRRSCVLCYLFRGVILASAMATDAALSRRSY